MDPVKLQLIITLLGIAAALATTVIEIAGTWLLSKVGKNKHLESIARGIELVQDAARLTVEELNQTTVEAMKKSNGGKLSDAQKAKLKTDLQTGAREKIAPAVIDLLAGAEIDITALIQSAAESYIWATKPITELVEAKPPDESETAA